MPFAPLLGPKEALIACMIDGPFSRGHKMATISRSDWMEKSLRVFAPHAARVQNGAARRARLFRGRHHLIRYARIDHRQHQPVLFRAHVRRSLLCPRAVLRIFWVGFLMLFEDDARNQFVDAGKRQRKRHARAWPLQAHFLRHIVQHLPHPAARQRANHHVLFRASQAQHIQNIAGSRAPPVQNKIEMNVPRVGKVGDALALAVLHNGHQQANGVCHAPDPSSSSS